MSNMQNNAKCLVSVVAITAGLIAMVSSFAVDRWGQYTSSTLAGQIVKVRFSFGTAVTASHAIRVFLECFQ